jgi:hypothetical protein
MVVMTLDPVVALRRTVPPALPFIVFLGHAGSGGQQDSASQFSQLE